MRLTPHEWTIATQACTPTQLQALDYWNHGYGYKRISIILGISVETTRGRITRGLGAIQRHQRIAA